LQTLANNIIAGGVTPEPAPEPVPPTAEQLATQEKMEWLRKKAALATMIDDMKRAREIDKEPSPEQLAIMKGLAEWINHNMKQEYYF
jgi:hypothetical protein